jgi:hypothetical protein
VGITPCWIFIYSPLYCYTALRPPAIGLPRTSCSLQYHSYTGHPEDSKTAKEVIRSGIKRTVTDRHKMHIGTLTHVIDLDVVICLRHASVGIYCEQQIDLDPTVLRKTSPCLKGYVVYLTFTVPWHRTTEPVEQLISWAPAYAV